MTLRRITDGLQAFVVSVRKIFVEYDPLGPRAPELQARSKVECAHDRRSQCLHQLPNQRGVPTFLVSENVNRISASVPFKFKLDLLFMIDAVFIFTRGGLILWSLEIIPVESNVIDSFIKNCLLEHRTGDNRYTSRDYEFRWVSVNRLGTTILVVYKGILESSYLDTMLSSLKAKVLQKVDSDSPLVPIDLSSDFPKILDKCDRAGSRGPRTTAPSVGKPVAEPKSKSGAKKGKEGRAWGISDKADDKVMKQLDFSKPTSASVPAANQALFDESSDSDHDSDLDIDVSKKGGIFGKLVSSVQNLTGNAQLGKAQLEPVLNTFQEGLMLKNVARDVAVKIVESVGNQLVGTRTERFTSIASTVKDSITRSIEEILTPKRSIDILKAALDARVQGRVYSVAFLGVNGVGKSTNLAKVAYYLKNKGGLKILLAACDTFRAGAVEQLRVHATNLNIDIFERGYGKDSAEIAKQALAQAKAGGYDVCLIDTAGRMQDNEPLMRAIAKLVAVNTPDLVLFVGEALVGHDAVDQLTKFNRALIDYSLNPANPRTVDGIILTKYDTVDDKVGAALSMVYVTGQPIVFVGTGQKYPNLRKLQVKQVVRALVG
jgi:signal recognition particle receptor subunit alpha